MEPSSVFLHVMSSSAGALSSENRSYQVADHGEICLCYMAYKVVILTCRLVWKLPETTFPARNNTVVQYLYIRSLSSLS